MSTLFGLQGTGVDLLSQLPAFGGKGGGDVFFARMINMAFGILLNSSIRFNDLDSLQRRPVTHAEMISCDFSKACFWYTEGLEGYPWKWAPRLPEALAILSATNALALPRYPPFVFQYLSGARGDRLVSTPIPCQSSTGVLQFQFWRSSQIKLHVCTLDQFDDALQCDEVQAGGHLSGYTTVSVPASDQPQRIAIFAEGSGFVALDDIAYTAELCTNRRRLVTESPTNTSSPSPLLPAVVEETVEPWSKLERREGLPIGSSSDLICDTFGGGSKHPCRWGTNADAYWTVVTEPSIVVALGNITMPEGEGRDNSLGSRIRENTWPSLVSFADAPIGALISDPIWCQKGDGQFIFKMLSPPGVSVRVCAVSIPSGVEMQCSEALNASSAGYPGPIAVDFAQILRPFEIHIRPTYESDAIDRFLLLDELAYFGDVCPTAGGEDGEEGARKVTRPPKEIRAIGGRPSIITAAPPTTTAIATTIRPPTTTQRILPTTPTQRILPTTPTQRILPTPFTTIIPFGWWFTQSTTPSSRISPFTRPPIQPVTVRRVESRTLSPFRNIHTRVVTPRLRRPKPTRRPKTNTTAKDKRSTCQKLSCSFNDGFCGYTQGGFFGNAFWERRDRPMGRPLSRHTDIRPTNTTGHYLAVLLHRDDDRSAILESPEFSITRLAYLRFEVFTATVGARVRVCFDTHREKEYREYRRRNFRRPRNTLKHCRQVFTEVNAATARRWNTISALMIPGFQKFFIVVDHVSQHNTFVAVGIDHIRVSPCDQ